MGKVEQTLRDRAADSLAEIATLDIRPMFGGYGFYISGLLVAAAWDRAFRLRYRENGHSVYKPVADSDLDEPTALVRLVQQRAQSLREDVSCSRGRRR